MSTLEATISMLETLPEADIKAIHDVIYSIYSRNTSPLKPVTKEQILLDLAVSRDQIKEGRFRDAESAISDIEARYGI